MSLFKRTGAVIVALFLTLTLIAPQTARADDATDKSITNASTWIADTWRDNQKLFFAAGTTADGVIALSAADEHPDTVESMLLDLKKRGPAFSEGYPAGLAKIIMTADIAGQNPRTFYGCDRDLVKELQALIATPAGQKKAKEYWGPHLIAIALSRAGEQVPSWVIDYLSSTQKNGGFGYTENDGTFVADPDYTAVGISAMDRISENNKVPANIRSNASKSVTNAVNWSADSANQIKDTASNSSYWATYSSANSTGMLASALGEVGEDIVSPTRYLVSQQNGDGGWAAAHKEPGKTRKSDVMATTQAVLGVIGEGYGTARSTQVPELNKCGTPPTTSPVKPTYPKTVYNTPGHQTVNGREWYTTCEKYSQTTRCFANIKATKVTQVGGRFVARTDFVFNNLTYLPAPAKFWTENRNPLGYAGQWTAADGRKWKTECNTPVTGNGCRSYIWARVVENVAKPGQPIRYAWVEKWEFNNMVQYS